MARELRKEADLIFMPYNYVLDFKVRFFVDCKWMMDNIMDISRIIGKAVKITLPLAYLLRMC